MLRFRIEADESDDASRPSLLFHVFSTEYKVPRTALPTSTQPQPGPNPGLDLSPHATPDAGQTEEWVDARMLRPLWVLAGTHLQHVWRADSPAGLVVYDDGCRHDAPPPPPSDAEPDAAVTPGDAVGQAGAPTTEAEVGVGARASAEAPETPAADAAAADAAASSHAKSGSTPGSGGAAARGERPQAGARPSRQCSPRGARHSNGGGGAAEPPARHADADADADVDERSARECDAATADAPGPGTGGGGAGGGGAVGGGAALAARLAEAKAAVARERRASAELLRYAEELQSAYRSLWLERHAGGEGVMPEVALRTLPLLPA